MRQRELATPLSYRPPGGSKEWTPAKKLSRIVDHATTPLQFDVVARTLTEKKTAIVQNTKE